MALRKHIVGAAWFMLSLAGLMVIVLPCLWIVAETAKTGLWVLVELELVAMIFLIAVYASWADETFMRRPDAR